MRRKDSILLWYIAVLGSDRRRHHRSRQWMALTDQGRAKGFFRYAQSRRSFESGFLSLYAADDCRSWIDLRGCGAWRSPAIGTERGFVCFAGYPRSLRARYGDPVRHCLYLLSLGALRFHDAGQIWHHGSDAALLIHLQIGRASSRE